MSVVLGGYSAGVGGGSSEGGTGSAGSSGSGHPPGPSGDGLLYADVARALSPMTVSGTHGPLPPDTCCGQVNDWHHHHHQSLTRGPDPRHGSDLHSPYSQDSDSACVLSPSPDFSLSGLSCSSGTNCMSIGSSSSSQGSNTSSTKYPEDSGVAVFHAAGTGHGGPAPGPPAKKCRRRGGPSSSSRGPRTPPRQNIDVNDNSLYAVYELFKSFLSASTASTVAIDNKIEQAMDLVKSHLMFAVREEVEVLKEKITELMERINQLEYENTVLKQYATNEALQQIQQHHNSNT